MALYAKTWKLARHGRIRTRRPDHPVPEPPHSRQADPRKRSRSLGAPPKQAPRQSRLAIHNSPRPRQTQKAVPRGSELGLTGFTSCGKAESMGLLIRSLFDGRLALRTHATFA